MLKRKGNCRRNLLDRRPMALFWRLVRTRGLVPRRMGHRHVRTERSHPLSPRRRQIEPQLVAGRNVRLKPSSRFSVLSLKRNQREDDWEAGNRKLEAGTELVHGTPLPLRL